MKNLFSNILFMFLLLIVLHLSGINTTFADWYERPDTRPTQPSMERALLEPLPTQAPLPTTETNNPTSPPSQPSITPRVGGDTGSGSSGSGSGGSSSSSNDDPCAEGKSFIGPYCGWSPRVGGEQGDPGLANAQLPAQTKKIVRGLSYTSGWDLLPSDIMLLTGILCLLLYLRSKLVIKKQLG